MFQQIADHQRLKGIHGFQVAQETASLGAGQRVQHEGIGHLCRNGQVVDPFQTLCLTQLQQAQDGLVGVLLFVQKIQIEVQVVDRSVGYHWTAFSVRNDAPGRVDILHFRNGVEGLGQIFLMMDHLGVEQNAQVDQQHHG